MPKQVVTGMPSVQVLLRRVSTYLVPLVAPNRGVFGLAPVQVDRRGQQGRTLKRAPLGKVARVVQEVLQTDVFRFVMENVEICWLTIITAGSVIALAEVNRIATTEPVSAPQIPKTMHTIAENAATFVVFMSNANMVNVYVKLALSVRGTVFRLMTT